MDYISYKRMMDKAVPSVALIQKTKSKMIKEDNTLSIETRSIKRPLTAVITVIVILSLLTAGVAFAYGSQIIELLVGGHIESGIDSGGNKYTSIYTEFDTDPVEVRNGRVYFILDNSDADITDYCTETTYYTYEQINDNGYRHVFVVGGTPDNLGWGEFIWNENGKMVGNTAFHKNTNSEQPEWLKLAEDILCN